MSAATCLPQTKHDRMLTNSGDNWLQAPASLQGQEAAKGQAISARFSYFQMDTQRTARMKQNYQQVSPWGWPCSAACSGGDVWVRLHHPPFSVSELEAQKASVTSLGVKVWSPHAVMLSGCCCRAVVRTVSPQNFAWAAGAACFSGRCLTPADRHVEQGRPDTRMLKQPAQQFSL